MKHPAETPTRPLAKIPTSVHLYDGANGDLDILAATLTLRTGRRHSRADAHRIALAAGISACMGVFASPSPAVENVSPCPPPSPSGDGE